MEGTTMLDFYLGMYFSHQKNTFFLFFKVASINQKRVNVCSRVLEQ